MNKAHLVLVPFTGLGLYEGYRGDTWLKNRIRIFKQFVIPSMMAQTNQRFTVWVSWRSKERKNPIVLDFIASLKRLRGLSFVHTFGGCPFYDDKYDDEVARERLMRTLELSLPDLEDTVSDADVVYLTLWPSDDMYLSSSIEKIQEYPYEEGRSIGFTKGHIMRYETKEIAEYNPTTIPPFFTIMFPRDVFLNPKKHFDYIGPYESHEYIKDKTKYISLEGRGFVVGTHGENISTRFTHPFKGETLEKERADQILILTGNYHTPPLTVEKDVYRKFMKKFVNLLPRKVQYHIIRFLSPGVKNSIRKYNYHNL